MNDAVSETTQPGAPPERFQFSLKRILFFSLFIGALTVYSPLLAVTASAIGSLIIVVVYASAIRALVALVIASLIAMVCAAHFLMIPADRPRGMSKATFQLKLLTTALQSYRIDHGALPLADFPKGNGAESLFHHLSKRVQPSAIPYFYPSYPGMVRDLDGDGYFELCSPDGADYVYFVNADGSAIVIDPGPDGLLGGTASAASGFVPNGQDANGDGVTDDKDNIYSR